MRGNAIQIAKLVNAQPQRDQYRKLQLARSPVAKKLQQEIELPLETQYTKDQLRGECGIAVGERVGGGQQFVTRVFPPPLHAPTPQTLRAALAQPKPRNWSGRARAGAGDAGSGLAVLFVFIFARVVASRRSQPECEKPAQSAARLRPKPLEVQPQHCPLFEIDLQLG